MRENNGHKWTENKTTCYLSHREKEQNERGGRKWTCYTFLALRDISAADNLDQ